MSNIPDWMTSAFDHRNEKQYLDYMLKQFSLFTLDRYELGHTKLAPDLAEFVRRCLEDFLADSEV